VHLSLEHIQANDKIYGSLPIPLVAEICAKGAEYWHLSLDLPAHLRGQELLAEQLTTVNARLERFSVFKS